MNEQNPTNGPGFQTNLALIAEALRKALSNPKLQNLGNTAYQEFNRAMPGVVKPAAMAGQGIMNRRPELPTPQSAGQPELPPPLFQQSSQPSMQSPEMDIAALQRRDQVLRQLFGARR